MLPPFDRSLDPAQCLGATRHIDVDTPAIGELVRSLDLASLPPRARAERVFRFVRDAIRYRFAAPADPAAYVASRILDDGAGFCVQKALVTCALGRAAGVPTAIVLADLRDRSLSRTIVAALGTDIMFHHGLTAFHVDGAWRIADASLSPDLITRKGYRQVEFDGRSDAVMAATTTDGRPHAEYLAIHGLYADLPFAQMLEAFAAGYAAADVRLLAEMGLAP